MGGNGVPGGSGGITHPRLRVGTSGWSYEHWSGGFYPAHLPASDRLRYYAAHFDTVEVNATFYRLPSASAVSTWRHETPEDFAFAVKGSRLITHFRRLGDVEEALGTFLGRVRGLGPKLDVILWQLPPTMKRDLAVLTRFLGLLGDAGPRNAIEFRHESWFAEDVFELLRDRNVALVAASGDALEPCYTPTADFVYARFHGTARYHGEYTRPALEPWAAFLREQHAAGRDCYAYFNNDAGGHAPSDAARLLGMLQSAETD